MLIIIIFWATATLRIPRLQKNQCVAGTALCKLYICRRQRQERLKVPHAFIGVMRSCCSMGLHRLLYFEILRIQLCFDHLTVFLRLFFFSPLDSNSSVTEGEVLKTVSPYARDLETFLLSLKLSFIVLISIYCCKHTSRKCEIGMSWIAPQSSPALRFCLQCGVGRALRESCPDGCLHRAELRVLSLVLRGGKAHWSIGHHPCILTKLTCPLVRMGRWWHWNKGFPFSVTVLVKWVRDG